MTISEVTAVTTTDLTGSVGLVCWGAATHKTGETIHCHAQIAASEKPFRIDKCCRRKKLSKSFFIVSLSMAADSAPLPRGRRQRIQVMPAAPPFGSAILDNAKPLNLRSRHNGNVAPFHPHVLTDRNRSPRDWPSCRMGLSEHASFRFGLAANSEDVG